MQISEKTVHEAPEVVTITGILVVVVGSATVVVVVSATVVVVSFSGFQHVGFGSPLFGHV